MTAGERIVSTVLNVDDFEPGRYARSRILKQAGYQVLEAGTGSAALESIRDSRPPVVILDVNLPDVSGLEVCRQIKTDPQLSGTMVLQISAQAIRASDWAVALEGGADAYLIEPIDPGVLLATINALLRLAQADRNLKATNDELRRSNEDLARFAYIASHDLQEPLRTITNYSQLLQRRYEKALGPEADTFIGFITGATGRMSALIRDLLVYSQAESNRAAENVSLQDCLKQALEDLQVSINESGATITAGELPVVEGNNEQLRHVFQNLISNAIKYRSPDPPQIAISAARLGSLWRIAVKDNGRGFAPKYAKQIFDAFRRLDHSEQGTGIGLAIVRRIVEAWGGTIWAESEVGSGATFYFTLKPAARP